MELFGTKEMLHLKRPRRRHAFFQKFLYFSQRNIVLGIPFFYVDSFLTRDRVNVPIQLKRVTLQNDDVPAKLRA
jgi:hypothetical protein